jgi:hypothetical protein
MGQQIYFHLPRMNTAEKWLSLHHPALERDFRISPHVPVIERPLAAELHSLDSRLVQNSVDNAKRRMAYGPVAAFRLSHTS